MKKGLTDITNIMRGNTQIAKVMRGTTLIWEFAVAVVAWATQYVIDYTSRTEADYGAVEDAVVLEADLNTGTEQEYLDAIAIYNPNGGHRTGKIYDVRDTTFNINLLSNSNNFTDWDNYLSGLIFTANDINAPDGYVGKASKLIEASGGTYHQFSAMNFTNSLGVITFSVFVKFIGTDRNVGIAPINSGSSGSGAFALFNSNGAYVSTVGTPALLNYSSVALSNGWFRISVTVERTGTGGSPVVRFFNGTDPTYSGNGTSGVYIYGAQLEAASNITTYDKTPHTDLTVTGGGGTRINAQGNVEEILYNRLIDSGNLTNAAWGVEGVTKSQSGDISIITETTTSNPHYVWQQGLPLLSISAEFKKLDKSIIVFGVGRSGNLSSGVSIDLDTNQVTNNNPAAITHTSQVLSDGWIRVWLYCNVNDSLYDNFVVGGSLGDYAGNINQKMQFRKPQMIYANVDKPYQLTLNTAAFPKIDYSTGQAAFLIEPTRTNLETYSYDLITATAWTGDANITWTLDQIGITGKPNTALLITDSTTSAYGQVSRSVSGVTGINDIIRVSVWIKKDNDESRFPEIAIISSAGTTSVQINTKTGALGHRVTDEHTTTVVDRQDWWEVVIISLVAVERITNFIIRPAMWSGVLGGGFSGTPTGSIIVGHVSVTKSSAVNETPIITNGALVTRTDNYYSAPFSVPPSFYMYLEFEAPLDSTYKAVAVSDGSLSDRAYIMIDNTNSIRALVTATTTGGAVIQGGVISTGRHKALLIANSTEVKLFFNGVLIGTELGKEFSSTYSQISTSSGSGTSRFFGKIFDWKVIRGTLTDQEAIDLTTI